MAYRYADRRDRWKAISAVLGVHAVLGLALITGLNVEIVSRTVERLEAFDISLPKPPPEEPPPPPSREDSSPEEEGAAGRKSDPTPIVAPKPRVVLPPRDVIVAATVPGTGTASSAGAATSGTGTGAGGTGAGRGGGGAGGGGAGSSPAQLIRNLTRGDYRHLAAGRLPTGRAMVSLRVEPDGSASNCRIVGSSGDATVDRGLCPLVTRRLRFRPARDRSGRPVPYDLQYVATWRI